MRPDDPTLGKYDGNYYTTGSLGFVPEILEIGLKGDADRDVYRSLVSDMAADKARQLDDEGVSAEDEEHPLAKAYRALREVLEGM